MDSCILLMLVFTIVFGYSRCQDLPSMMDGSEPLPSMQNYRDILVAGTKLVDHVSGSFLFDHLIEKTIQELKEYEKPTDSSLPKKSPNLDTQDTGEDMLRLIESRGFLAERYYVTTRDGYISQLFRLINPYIDSKHRKPVLLQHGFGLSSFCFMDNSEPDEADDWRYDRGMASTSLAITLANHGFDVFISNFRGNILATNHTHKNPHKGTSTQVKLHRYE